ncbi:hypothetical protein L6E12_18160 [Actinokineospora sp. PR83]|uniref:hypothetical protein n=1 Tax=Actinokineospora sp. PR83 TaxID=2884908 RepID=UPI001F1EAA4B|nr:hypothetical protein [Actinokineospora sp. PR83]MCG8917709.1 hypothetical protein [Actinokineospora sp. PR83]
MALYVILLWLVASLVWWGCYRLIRSSIRVAAQDWVLVTGLSAVTTFAWYRWGWSHLLVVDLEYRCPGHDIADTPSYFPLSWTCAGTEDLVPAYVNPILFVLLALTAFCAITALVKALRAPRRSTR